MLACTSNIEIVLDFISKIILPGVAIGISIFAIFKSSKAEKTTLRVTILEKGLTIWSQTRVNFNIINQFCEKILIIQEPKYGSSKLRPFISFLGFDLRSIENTFRQTFTDIYLIEFYLPIKQLEKNLITIKNLINYFILACNETKDLTFNEMEKIHIDEHGNAKKVLIDNLTKLKNLTNLDNTALRDFDAFILKRFETIKNK